VVIPASKQPAASPVVDARRDGYVGSPGFYLLNQACYVIGHALGVPYLVGSATQGKGWRDVDVRVILDDQAFTELFPDAGGSLRCSSRWSLVCASISLHLSQASGLPVDFQIQSRTHAERYHGQPRIPLGIYPTEPPASGQQLTN